MTISSSMASSSQSDTTSRRAGVGYLLIASLTVLCWFDAGLLLAEPSPALDTLVWRYVDTHDGREADELLDDILRREEATIQRVTAIFRKGRSYARQPTGSHSTIPVVARGRRHSYALAVPATYDPSQSYGLVLCLHGAGFTGEAYLERWAPRLGDRYLVACPTYMRGAWWTRDAEELVLAVMQDVADRYHVDPDRIYLTGMSNGGIGAWIIGMHHADLFAGLAPMASGIDDVLFPFLANLKHTPAYVIHGEKDQVMPVRLSREIVEELTKLGYDVDYREHDREHPMAGGHYFPKEELPDLVTWIDAHQRHVGPASLALVRDATHLQPFAWLRIDATDRIAAFPESLVEAPDQLIKQRVYAKLLATIGPDNHVEAAAALVKRYSLFLNEDLVDLAQPLRVTTNGRASFEGTLTPSLETMLRQARLRHDTHRLYSIHVTVTVP